jgi:hypothetical protein
MSRSHPLTANVMQANSTFPTPPVTPAPAVPPSGRNSSDEPAFCPAHHYTHFPPNVPVHHCLPAAPDPTSCLPHPRTVRYYHDTYIDSPRGSAIIRVDYAGMPYLPWCSLAPKKPPCFVLHTQTTESSTAIGTTIVADNTVNNENDQYSDPDAGDSKGDEGSSLWPGACPHQPPNVLTPEREGAFIKMYYNRILGAFARLARSVPPYNGISPGFRASHSPNHWVYHPVDLTKHGLVLTDMAPGSATGERVQADTMGLDGGVFVTLGGNGIGNALPTHAQAQRQIAVVHAQATGPLHTHLVRLLKCAFRNLAPFERDAIVSVRLDIEWGGWCLDIRPPRKLEWYMRWLQELRRRGIHPDNTTCNRMKQALVFHLGWYDVGGEIRAMSKVWYRTGEQMFERWDALEKIL